MLMRATMLLVVSSALLMAACGAEESGATADDAVQKAGVQKAGVQKASLGSGSVPLRAGLYHVVEADEDDEHERCIKAEDISAGRMEVSDMLRDGWVFDTNRMSGGTIELTARHPTGSHIKVSGTYEKEAFMTEGTLLLKVNGETNIIRTRQQGRFVSPTCPAEGE